MVGERTYPILTCPDLSTAIDFYTALGFDTTYRQKRPNPVCRRAAGGDQHPSCRGGRRSRELTRQRHRGGVGRRADVFPVRGRASRLLRTPALRADAADAATAPQGRYDDRLHRRGPGGNWLRFYREGDAETSSQPASGLARALEVAARQGDSRGDVKTALVALDAGLARHPDASPLDLARAHLYRAELLTRAGRSKEAETALNEAKRIPLNESDSEVIGTEIADAREHLE